MTVINAVTLGELLRKKEEDKEKTNKDLKISKMKETKNRAPENA